MIFKLIGMAIFVIALCLISAAQKPDLSKKGEDAEGPSLFSVLYGTNAWKRWAVEDNELDFGDVIHDPVYSGLSCNIYYTGDD